MEELSYYEILEVTKSADKSTIKKAYRAMAKKYHPDRISAAPDPEIKEKANFVFAEINKGDYEVYFLFVRIKLRSKNCNTLKRKR